jgi:tetratricopeptide (TPR) repeat protein
MTLILLALLPVAPIVPITTLLNDRYLYFPMLGVSALLAAGISAFFDSGKAWVRALGIGIALLALPLAVVSYKRCAVWSDSLTLWNDARKNAPDNTLVWSGLGISYQQRGNLKSALAAYQRALYLGPDNVLALSNLVLIHCHYGQLDIARPYLDRLLMLAPLDPTTRVAEGNYHYLKGDHLTAERIFRRALELDSTQELAYIMIANIRMEQGDYAGARDYINKGIKQSGEAFVEAEYALACLESRLNNPTAALRHLDRALQLGFNDFNQLTSDANLENLRETAEFKARVNQLQTPQSGITPVTPSGTSTGL